ncbi:hypothetical protein FEM03_23055 [Phragmitibacter flavus]|uniref:Uncharacterized protein n=1 Tax=Phragmitibacter flavus TaxID=2576071 RepID=A0A5R8K8W1_9BACT|nr:hypothetical protein FEM03_23055 [Phragmitibacter flavus]
MITEHAALIHSHVVTNLLARAIIAFRSLTLIAAHKPYSPFFPQPEDSLREVPDTGGRQSRSLSRDQPRHPKKHGFGAMTSNLRSRPLPIHEHLLWLCSASCSFSSWVHVPHLICLLALRQDEEAAGDGGDPNLTLSPTIRLRLPRIFVALE